MENAIIKAIEGGYNPSDETNWRIDKDAFGKCTLVYFSEEYPDEGSDEYDQNYILLDPRFFQALGKAEGWHIGIEKAICEKCKFSATNYKYRFCPEDATPLTIAENIKNSKWFSEWHRFIDHLAEGKDVNSFFEELLKE